MSRPTIHDLEVLLNSENNDPVEILPDGSRVVGGPFVKLERPQDGSFFLAWWNDCTVPRIVRPIAPGEDLYEQFWSDDPVDGAPRCWAPLPSAPDES